MQTVSSGCSASGAAVGCTKTVLVLSNQKKSAVDAKPDTDAKVLHHLVEIL